MSVEDQTRIDDHLRETLLRIFGFDFPAPSLMRSDWTGVPSTAVEKAATNYVNRESSDILAWETRRARTARNEWVERLNDAATLAAAEASTVDARKIAQRLAINRLSPTALPESDDLVLTKINHGFWEQLFLITLDGYLPHLTRPTARKGYTEAYLDSRFVDALVTMARAQAKITADGLSFDGIDLGISFCSGDFWHEGLMARLPRAEPETHRIARGVHAGLNVFLSQMPHALRATFIDGAYAKKGLTDGSLESLLTSMASKVDHAAFVVPGHLAGLRLVGLPSDRQQVLHVSGRLVHQAWPLMLAGVARPLLARLAAGEHVAVIVQAAVFSALLPLYLVQAKSALGLTGRLAFIDLGQALDVLTPETGSTWIKSKKSILSDGCIGLPISMRRHEDGAP